MSTHCDPNDKPTIYYKFKGDGGYRKIQIGTAPIEIIIEPLADFKKSIKTYNSYLDNQDYYYIEANSNRVRLVFRPIPYRFPNDDLFGSWYNPRTNQGGEIFQENPYNTGIGPEVIFEGNLAKDKYWIYIAPMFYGTYPYSWEYHEYFG